MQNFLLEKLSKINEDEKRILNGENIYGDNGIADNDFVISAENIGSGEVSISRHTRFAPFPRHRHNYIEMMIVLAGSITHRIEGREVRLKTGDALFLNRHISHSVDLAGKEDIGVNGYFLTVRFISYARNHVFRVFMNFGDLTVHQNLSAVLFDFGGGNLPKLTGT